MGRNPPGSQVCLDAVDWSGKQQTLYRYISSENIGTWAALSPDGSAAVVDDSGQPRGESVARASGPPIVIGEADTPFTWWLDGDAVAVYGTHVTGTAGAFYRLSTAKLVPLGDDLGWMDGVVPGIS